MKHFAIILIALLTLGAAQAQRPLRIDTTRSIDEQIVQFKEFRQKRRAEMLAPRHQFRLNLFDANPGSDYFGVAQQPGNIRKEAGKTSVTYMLEYSYRAVDFLEVGLGVGYRLSRQWLLFDNATNLQVGQERSDVLNLSLNFRYNWLNRRWITLYSSIGVGVAIIFDSSTVDNVASPATTRAQLIPEIVPFGMRIGKKFFGYIEPIGYSLRGVYMMCGIGYRF